MSNHGPSGDTRRGRRRLRTAARVVFLASLIGASAPAAATIDDARRLAADGDYAAALAEVDKVLAESPGDVQATLLRGVLLSSLGNGDGAIETFRALARERPDLPEPHNNLAVIFAAQGRYEDARDELLEALRLQPDYDVAHENLGDIYTKLAALSYRRAATLNDSNRRAAAKARAAERSLERDRPQGPRRDAATTADEATARVAAPPAPAPKARVADESCAEITGLGSRDEAERVAAWLRDAGVRASVKPAAPARAGFRVLLPPLESRAAARARVAELQAAGVRDLFVIRSGAHANGISLGVYSEREGAERRARELAAVGVQASVEPREQPPGPLRVEARGDYDVARFAQSFPAAVATGRACP